MILTCMETKCGCGYNCLRKYEDKIFVIWNKDKGFNESLQRS